MRCACVTVGCLHRKGSGHESMGQGVDRGVDCLGNRDRTGAGMVATWCALMTCERCERQPGRLFVPWGVLCRDCILALFGACWLLDPRYW